MRQPHSYNDKQLIKQLAEYSITLLSLINTLLEEPVEYFSVVRHQFQKLVGQENMFSIEFSKWRIANTIYPNSGHDEITRIGEARNDNEKISVEFSKLIRNQQIDASDLEKKIDELTIKHEEKNKNNPFYKHLRQIKGKL